MTKETLAEIDAEHQRLIAINLELLAALKAIVEHEMVDGIGIRYTFDWHSPLGKQARAAIAKAEARP